ncbi:fumarylacetoacetate hydrolase family protein [Mesorhizobium atlanticum]|nr:fumarylacetoacetate hydrolase family protein [Mesorhizobium atlanticum]
MASRPPAGVHPHHGVVIGKPAKYISQAQAFDHIAGYYGR